MSDVATDTSLGVLELLGSGAGFLRRPEAGYLPSDDDIYVHQNVIQKFDLRTGDELAGEVGNPPSKGKSPPLRRLTAVNGVPPDDVGRRPDFNRLSAQHPDEQYMLECGLKRQGSRDFTNRIIDLFCPLGKGQRMLIVAPAKAGKTMVLQAIAEGVVTNAPDTKLLILLVDERPEEVTEMENTGFGEVVSSSFDFPAELHPAVIERLGLHVVGAKDALQLLRIGVRDLIERLVDELVDVRALGAEGVPAVLLRHHEIVQMSAHLNRCRSSCCSVSDIESYSRLNAS